MSDKTIAELASENNPNEDEREMAKMLLRIGAIITPNNYDWSEHSSNTIYSHSDGGNPVAAIRDRRLGKVRGHVMDGFRRNGLIAKKEGDYE